MWVQCYGDGMAVISVLWWWYGVTWVQCYGDGMYVSGMVGSSDVCNICRSDGDHTDSMMKVLLRSVMVLLFTVLLLSAAMIVMQVISALLYGGSILSGVLVMVALVNFGDTIGSVGNTSNIGSGGGNASEYRRYDGNIGGIDRPTDPPPDDTNGA